MNHSSRLIVGITLIEVLVVVVVVSILVAIAFPVLGNIRKRNAQELTISNLRQVWLALEIYRQDHDGNVSLGTSSQLGLPNRDGFPPFYRSLGLQWWRTPDKIAYGPVYYPMDPSDAIAQSTRESVVRMVDRWLRYNGRAEGASVIVGDFHHTEGCGRYPQPLCRFLGFGVTLDGALRRRGATGEIHLAEWWEE